MERSVDSGFASSAELQFNLADADLTTLIDALAPGNFKDREAAIGALVATGDPRVVHHVIVYLDANKDAPAKAVFQTSLPYST